MNESVEELEAQINKLVAENEKLGARNLQLEDEIWSQGEEIIRLRKQLEYVTK